MKSIIRRASHGNFNYRTTDEDGHVVYWFSRPVAVDSPSGGRWKHSDYAMGCWLSGEVRSVKGWRQSIVRIGK
jgi:hypothetical protein